MASFLFFENMLQLCHARVVKLVDTHALGACAERLASSSLVAGTNYKKVLWGLFLFWAGFSGTTLSY